MLRNESLVLSNELINVELPSSFESATQKISFSLFFRAWILCKNSFVFAVFLNFIACDL